MVPVIVRFKILVLELVLCICCDPIIVDELKLPDEELNCTLKYFPSSKLPDVTNGIVIDFFYKQQLVLLFQS
jgi:hypothetical protein